eukprot:TRINITY_DN1092_c0_g2_i1.p1 TRINITY_DN1092_c0_g2~~TRINITY_DN1092_c0_g2_i1.p1  ORF type:complete len:258 (+),score=19.14 TRINITY_DN1092_c0_g2_i1:263-1036(+)
MAGLPPGFSQFSVPVDSSEDLRSPPDRPWLGPHISSEFQQLKAPSYNDHDFLTSPNADQGGALSAPSIHMESLEEFQSTKKEHGRSGHIKRGLEGKKDATWLQLLNPWHECIDPSEKCVREWKEIFLVSSLIAFGIDPCYFFVAYINVGQHCVQLDWNLVLGLTIIRSATDLVYLIHMYLQLRIAYVYEGKNVFNRWRKFLRHTWFHWKPISGQTRYGAQDVIKEPKLVGLRYARRWLLFDIWAVLPLPQVRERARG